MSYNSETHTHFWFSKTLQINALQPNFYVYKPEIIKFCDNVKITTLELSVLGKIIAKINKQCSFGALLREFNNQTKYICTRIQNTEYRTLQLP